MTLRPIAALLGIGMVLGLACVASAEDQPRTTTPADSTKPGASGDTAKDNGTTKDEVKPKGRVKLEKATFGSGCFWCGEAIFERIPGVKAVVSGYAGGNVPYPTYEMVSTGETGHAEVFQITFDPSEITFDTLLKVFWASHDSTTLNAQGPDFGTQYRSILFYHDEAQRIAIQKSYKDLADKGVFLNSITTQVVPMTAFFPAEAYHQDYYRKHRSAMYCQMYIVPKLKKLHLIK